MFRSLPLALPMPQGQLEEHACVACVDKLECCHVWACCKYFAIFDINVAAVDNATFYFFGLDAPMGNFNLNTIWLNQGKYK